MDRLGSTNMDHISGTRNGVALLIPHEAATSTQMFMDLYTSKCGMLWYCAPVMPFPPSPPLALADCVVVAADRERTKAEAAAWDLL